MLWPSSGFHKPEPNSYPPEFISQEGGLLRYIQRRKKKEKKEYFAFAFVRFCYSSNGDTINKEVKYLENKFSNLGGGLKLRNSCVNLQSAPQGSGKTAPAQIWRPGKGVREPIELVQRHVDTHGPGIEHCSQTLPRRKFGHGARLPALGG